MPITWRNVDAPSFGESNRLMQSGLNAITGGLQNTSDTITENWDRVKQQNTDRYAAEIMAAQDMDAVANLRASLTPDQLNGRYEGQIDTVGLMGALQDQGRFVRQDMMEQQEFQDQQARIGSRDAVSGLYNTLYTQGTNAAIQQKQDLIGSGEVAPWLLDGVGESIYNVKNDEFNQKLRLQEHGWRAADAAMKKLEFQWKQEDRITAEANRKNSEGFRVYVDNLLLQNPHADPEQVRRSIYDSGMKYEIPYELIEGVLEDLPTIRANLLGTKDETREYKNTQLDRYAQEVLFNGLNTLREGATDENGNATVFKFDLDTMIAMGREAAAQITNQEDRERFVNNITSMATELSRMTQAEFAEFEANMLSHQQAWQEEVQPFEDAVDEAETKLNNLEFRKQTTSDRRISPQNHVSELRDALNIADKTRGFGRVVNNKNFNEAYNDVKSSVSRILENASEQDILRVVDYAFRDANKKFSDKDNESGIYVLGGLEVGNSIHQNAAGTIIDFDNLMKEAISTATSRYIEERDLEPKLIENLRRAQMKRDSAMGAWNFSGTMMGLGRGSN